MDVMILCSIWCCCLCSCFHSLTMLCAYEFLSSSILRLSTTFWGLAQARSFDEWLGTGFIYTCYYYYYYNSAHSVVNQIWNGMLFIIMCCERNLFNKRSIFYYSIGSIQCISYDDVSICTTHWRLIESRLNYQWITHERVNKWRSETNKCSQCDRCKWR